MTVHVLTTLHTPVVLLSIPLQDRAWSPVWGLWPCPCTPANRTSKQQGRPTVPAGTASLQPELHPNTLQMLNAAVSPGHCRLRRLSFLEAQPTNDRLVLLRSRDRQRGWLGGVRLMPMQAKGGRMVVLGRQEKTQQARRCLET